MALVDARYGALGVIAPDGAGLERFIHVGVDSSTVAHIGHLPTGQGAARRGDRRPRADPARRI